MRPRLGTLQGAALCIGVHCAARLPGERPPRDGERVDVAGLVLGILRIECSVAPCRQRGELVGAAGSPGDEDDGDPYGGTGARD